MYRYFFTIYIQALNYSKVVNIHINAMKISPNPISKGEILQIHTKEKIQTVNLMSVDGRIVAKLEVNKFNQVEILNAIPSATYFLEILTNKGSYKQKLNIN